MAVDTTLALHGVIAAAGSGVRMAGHCKPLVRWSGATLLEHTIHALATVCADGVAVVVGDRLEQVAPVALAAGAAVVQNPAWADGLAGSLRAGLDASPATAAGVLFALCDQPLIDATGYGRLANAWRAQPNRIAASAYCGTIGVPVIVPATQLDSIASALAGDRGAQGWLQAAGDNVTRIPMPDAAFDIDTPEDLRAALARKNN